VDGMWSRVLPGTASLGRCRTTVDLRVARRLQKRNPAFGWRTRFEFTSMALFSALVTTDDLELRTAMVGALRSQGVSIGIVEERSASGAGPTVALVDIRSECSPGLSTIERVRAKWPAVFILAVADSSETDVILQAMRAGANEFCACPNHEERLRLSVEDGLRDALIPIVERLKVVRDDAKPTSQTFAFFGAKGGAGTTTMAVNCAVQLARLPQRRTIVIDLNSFLGEVALFLQAQPRFTLIDAVDNLHRLDSEFLRELVTPHSSGLDILAGSDTVDRPNGQDAGALEEFLQWLGDYYEFIVIDAGNLTSASSQVAVFVADAIFLVMDTLDTAISNSKRILERMEGLGAGKDRVRVLLNRTSDKYFIATPQIEAALGYPIYHAFPNDYDTVSSALNSGVPMSADGDSAIAREFLRFTRKLAAQPDRRRLPEEMESRTVA
jgi:pilus assembly protein CpaE